MGHTLVFGLWIALSAFLGLGHLGFLWSNLLAGAVVGGLGWNSILAGGLIAVIGIIPAASFPVDWWLRTMPEAQDPSVDLRFEATAGGSARAGAGRPVLGGALHGVGNRVRRPGAGLAVRPAPGNTGPSPFP